MIITREKVQALAQQLAPEVIDIRRHLHMNPELSFMEFKTSGFIIDKLKQWGIPCTGDFTKTGIVAVIEGKNPVLRIVGLRADMDALPITEKNNTPYKSVNEGVMHACGHDVHSASLLGTAKILNELKADFEGTIKLIFQPGEEKIPGGARSMIEEGALGNPLPDVIIGQHVLPSMEAGIAGFRKGIYMASSDEIYIKVTGKGGHAAMPDQITDTVLAASQIIVSLQNIVSRFSPPSIPSVLSFGKVIANGATNVIPDEVRIEGTFRTMNEQWRQEAHAQIEKTAMSVAQSLGAECETEIRIGYPVLINDNEVTERAIQAAREYLGDKNVKNLEIRMTAEDFSYYSQLCPSTFYRLGTGNVSKNITSPLHSANFDVDENSLETGSGLMAWIALSFLKD